jgi:16S rRNA (cytidine1402-2'-O)-methyltransferase
MGGRLYVVATPIGNLGDITVRAIDVLGKVDFVVAENRSRALKLLSYLNIHKPLITINSYNEQRKASEIAVRLLDGNDIALITAAGTPCVSDPGIVVVRKVYEAGMEVSAVPGPSAVAAAVSISGLYADRFLFLGFLPQKRGKKKKILREFCIFPYPMILFESPRRIIETLRCISEELGDREVTVLKEMTKIYEQVLRAPVSQLIDVFSEGEQKGEYTIIVEGKGG